MNTDDEFREALKRLKSDKRLTIRELAEGADCSDRHIQGLLSDTEKKGAGKELGDRIASFLGMTYSDMLALGRAIISGEDPSKPSVLGTMEEKSTLYAGRTSPLTAKSDFHHVPDRDESPISETEMTKLIFAQVTPFLDRMPDQIRDETMKYFRGISPDWAHKEIISNSGLEPHSEKMLQHIRELAWKDEEIGDLGGLGFGTAKTDRDYLKWKITNKELYEICRQEARDIKSAFAKLREEEKSDK